MKLFAQAIRNCRRTPARTRITIGAMAMACAIMIFYASLLNGWLVAMEHNAVAMDLGEIQIHAPGYRQDPDLYLRLDKPEELIARLKQAGFAAAPRLYGAGLVAAGKAASGVQIRGVDLAGEPQITSLFRHILAGQWLDDLDPAGVVLGRKLAKTLGVQVGDELVLVVQAADGSTADRLLRVRGVLKSVGEGLDRGGLFMTASGFRELFLLPAGAHQLVVKRLDRSEGLEAAADRLTRLLPAVEVRHWRQLQPVLARLLAMSDISLMIMLLICYVAVGVLTLNAQLMSVFERIPEFGLMKALGLAPIRIFLLLLIETTIQVTVAAGLALAAGLPTVLYFSRHPIDFSGFVTASSTIAGTAFEPKWYCVVSPGTVLMPVLFLYLISGLAILYPAGKAALLKPLAALTHR